MSDQNNYQTYTYFTTSTNFNPTILDGNTVSGTYTINDKKFIPVNFVTIPATDTLPQQANSTPQASNIIYGIVPSNASATGESKPVIINVSTPVSAATPSYGEPSNVTTIINTTTPSVPSSKKKARPRTVDTVKVKIEQLKQRKGRKQKVPGQTREERKLKANTNKPYINSKGK